ncbi:Flavin carrier protein 1 [Leucoagaricus sp. SymC.cos]|nr:Flavin carrier protein 1 [Leucoagaricus sp. SymC.cos]
MFSVLARSRALVVPLFLWPVLAYSQEEALFASSVTYCEQPQTLLIQQFDIAFFPANQSVSFNVSAASVTPNVNVSANLMLNVYGMHPINFTLDLCSVLNGALCPLPTYNFVGADSIRLPQSLGIDGRIPGIAFKIPDLEGFAQLTLTEIGTGEVKACIQATLSNGWSTHQPAVEYVTASFALAAFLSALVHSVFPDSLAPFRFLDLFYLYQAIATSAFLNINYPSLYRAFTINFAWAVGLVSSRTSSLQHSIDNMRHHTGGNMTDSTSNSAVGFVNRRLSPFNQYANGNTVTAGFSLIRRGTSALSDILQVLSQSNLRVTDAEQPALNPNLKTNLAMQPAVQGEVQVVTQGSANVLNAGIPIYTNTIHIGTANAFMTAFIVALIVLVIGGAVLVCGYGVAVAIRQSRIRKGKEAQFDYFSFVKAWLVRLGLLFLLPLLIFTFYQWTLKDSWLSILLSVITFIGLLVLLTFPPYLILNSVRKSKNPYGLYSYSSPTHLTSLGPLYAQFRPERYYVFLTLLVVPFVKAIFISFAKPSGLAQVILLFVTEFVVLGLQIAFKPHKTRGGDVLSTYLGLTRLVATGLMIAFVERVAVNAIPRTVIGAIIGVIWSVAVVILILDLVIYHILVPLWLAVTGRSRAEDSTVPATNSPLNSEGSMLEKGEKRHNEEHFQPHHDVLPTQSGITPAPSWDRVTAGRRALNPTPNQNIPLDPQILQVYPVSPTESITTGHGSEIPTLAWVV